MTIWKKRIICIILLAVLVFTVFGIGRIQLDNGDHYQITSIVTDKLITHHRVASKYFIVANGKIIYCSKDEYYGIEEGKEYIMTICQTKETKLLRSYKELISYQETK